MYFKLISFKLNVASMAKNIPSINLPSFIIITIITTSHSCIINHFLPCRIVVAKRLFQKRKKKKKERRENGNFFSLCCQHKNFFLFFFFPPKKLKSPYKSSGTEILYGIESIRLRVNKFVSNYVIQIKKSDISWECNEKYPVSYLLRCLY